MTDDYAALVSRVRKLEAELQAMADRLAEQERRPKRDYHDAPAYRMNAEGKPVPLWPVADEHHEAYGAMVHTMQKRD